MNAYCFVVMTYRISFQFGHLEDKRNVAEVTFKLFSTTRGEISFHEEACYFEAKYTDCIYFNLNKT